MKRLPHRIRRAQRGAVLLIGMVMLIMMTLVALAVIRLSMHHTQIVNNEQLRAESVAAANYALDMVLNMPKLTWDGYKGAGQQQLINLGLKSTLGEDATETIAVTVSNLECRRSRVLKNFELIKKQGSFAYVAPDDTSCFGGGGSPLTIVDPTAIGTPTDDSLCATVLYEMRAQAADAKLLGATTTLSQGVEVRTDVTTLSSACP